MAKQKFDPTKALTPKKVIKRTPSSPSNENDTINQIHKPKMERVNFYIQADLKRQIKIYAAANDTSVTEIFNDLIKSFLAENS